MYNITFDRIRQQPPSQVEMAMLILTWVYLAQRKLRVCEVQHALAVQAGDTEFIEDGIPPEEPLIDCCLGLVVIERETSTIRFAHFTLQEYLDKHWRDLFPSGHSTIASTCCTYLTFDPPGLSNEDWEENSILLIFLANREWQDAPTLFSYAANFLGDHLREDTNEELDHQALKLFTDKTKFQLLRVAVQHEGFRECPSPLHWAAYFGVPSLAATFLRTSNYSINTWDDCKHTPLTYAALTGREAVAKLLLGVEGVDVDSKDDEGRIPLSYAA
jgi:hypothetical protein